MKTWLLFLFLAVLLGAGSWVVLSSDPAAGNASAANVGLLEVDSAQRGAPSESSTPDASDNISSAVDRRKLESRPAEASLAAGLAAALPFEGPSALIKMKLVDGDGNQIEDGTAKFLLLNWDPRSDEIDAEAWKEANTLAVNAHGELAAAVPIGHTFRLEVGGAFWRTQKRMVQPLQTDEVVDLGEIALTPANRVAGIVVNKKGEPLAEARVTISETVGSQWGGNFQDSRVTQADGKFFFEGVRSGRFKFDVQAQGYVKTLLRAENIQQRQGDFPLEIVLERGASTRGRVVDEDGVAIAGARIFTLPVDENFRFYGNQWNPPIPEETVPAAVSDHNGDFVIYGLDSEMNLKLGANAEGFGAGYAEEVEVDGNALIKLPRHFLVSGHVTAGGTGVEFATVKLQRFREDGEMDWGGQAQTEETGEFSFKPLAPGSYTLSLTSALGTIEEQALEVTEDVKDLRLELALDNLLTIHVLDANGKAVSDAKISLTPEEQGGGDDIFVGDSSFSVSLISSFGYSDSGRRGRRGNPSHRISTDNNGVAIFASVPASRYTLSVQADGFATFEDPLEITGTTQNHDVELSTGGHLRVRVVDGLQQPVVGIQVALRTADAEKEMPSISTDAAGRAIWNDLEAGAYQISYSASDAGGWWWDREDDPEAPVDQSTVKIKVGATTDFELAVNDLALVTVHVSRHGAHAQDVKVNITEVVEDQHGFWGGSNNGGQATDGRGEAELAPIAAGEYEISVKGGMASPATKLKLQLYVGSQRVEIELDGGAVQGKLLETSGALTNATVALAPVVLETGDPQRRNSNFVSYNSGGGYTYSNSDEQSTNTRTDRYGNYEFFDIPDGQWRVIARAQGFGTWESEPFTVQGGNAVQLGSHHMYPGAVIFGHDANFVPPTDNNRNNNRWRRGPQIQLRNGEKQMIAMAAVDERGDFRIEDLPSGTFLLRRGRFTSEAIEVADGGTYRMDIPLEEPRKDQK